MDDSEPLGYAKPPLDELAVGVQFGAPVVDQATILADFWPRFRAGFPTHEAQPPIGRNREDFRSPLEQAVSPVPEEPYAVMGGEFPQRYWFASDDSRRLVQIQPDRLVVNWRRSNPDDDYPRFGAISTLLRERLHDLNTAVGEERLAAVGADLCEVTYVNHFDATSSDGVRRRPLSEFLTTVADVSPVGLDPVEETQLVQSFVIRSGEKPVGRFRLSAIPGVRNTDGRLVYGVSFSARVLPQASGTDGIFDALDVAHRLLRSNFEEMTTEAAQHEWRTDG